jgi:hypothetical protein
VPLEAVVSEDAAQVWVAAEEDAIHVPHLTLKPVGSGVDGHKAGHCSHLVTAHLGEGGGGCQGGGFRGGKRGQECVHGLTW